MSDRKRINMSVDPETYNTLKKLTKKFGFTSVCEMLLALANILIDRITEPINRKLDLPDEDGKDIDEMFKELSNTQRQPIGEVPVRHIHRSIYKAKNGK